MTSHDVRRRQRGSDAADIAWTATPTDDYVIVGVHAMIHRVDGSVEKWPLDLDAYRDGRYEPAPTIANGESLVIVTDYA